MTEIVSIQELSQKPRAWTLTQMQRQGNSFNRQKQSVEGYDS